MPLSADTLAADTFNVILYSLNLMPEKTYFPPLLCVTHFQTGAVPLCIYSMPCDPNSLLLALP